MPAGYSGTPLCKKLGIRPGHRVCPRGAPAHYPDLLAPLPPDVTLSPRFTRDVDIVHLFTADEAELRCELPRLLPRIRQDGALWVSWPKKSSGVPSTVTEDTVRACALPLGLVDIKVCAVDEVWSALKLVIRKANRR